MNGSSFSMKPDPSSGRSEVRYAPASPSSPSSKPVKRQQDTSPTKAPFNWNDFFNWGQAAQQGDASSHKVDPESGLFQSHPDITA